MAPTRDLLGWGHYLEIFLRSTHAEWTVICCRGEAAKGISRWIKTSIHIHLSSSFCYPNLHHQLWRITIPSRRSWLIWRKIHWWWMVSYWNRFLGDPLQGIVATRGQLIEQERRIVSSLMAQNGIMFMEKKSRRCGSPLLPWRPALRRAEQYSQE